MIRRALLWGVPAICLACLSSCGSKPQPDVGVERTAATRTPRFEDQKLKDTTYRFIAERNDMLRAGAAFFPDASKARECEVTSPAFERLFFGGTRSDWASSGMAISNATVAVIDGSCAGGGIGGPANVLVTFGYADTRGEVTQTRWLVGDFDATGMTAGVRYSSSLDMGEQTWAITYVFDPTRSLHFDFTRTTLSTFVDESVAPNQVSRTVYEGEVKATQVHLLSSSKRHGLKTTFQDGAVATESCFVLGEEVPRERCDGPSVQLDEAEQATFDRALAEWTRPSTTPTAAAEATASNGSWPELEPLMKVVGGGEADAAVIVGIEDYAFVADVGGATQNARDWYRYFTRSRGTPAASVRLLTDEQATDDGIRDAVAAAAQRVGAGGTLWFVFVGHGAPAKDQKNGLLVGVDAQQTATGLYGRSIGQDEVIALASRGGQQNTVLVVDACFSGRTPSGVLAPGLQPMLAVSLTVTDRRALVFSAGRSDEFAGPLPNGSRPAFSYLMLGGLLGWADSNADGALESQEVLGYVRDALASVVVDRKQTPELTPVRSIPMGMSGGAPAPDLTKIVLGE